LFNRVFVVSDLPFALGIAVKILFAFRKKIVAKSPTFLGNAQILFI